MRKTMNKLLVVFTILTCTLVASQLIAGNKVGDADITYWVKDALRHDPRVDASKIEASTEEGTVTLSGSVDNLSAKKYADLEASKINGVLGVVNKIAIKKGPVRPALPYGPIVVGGPLVTAIVGGLESVVTDDFTIYKQPSYFKRAAQPTEIYNGVNPIPQIILNGHKYVAKQAIKAKIPFASEVLRLKTQTAEQNTFARTAKADDGGDIARINLKINAIKYRAVTETLGDSFKFD